MKEQTKIQSPFETIADKTRNPISIYGEGGSYSYLPKYFEELTGYFFIELEGEGRVNE